MLVMLVSAASGAFLALRRYPAFALAPAAAFFAAAAMVTGIATGHDARTIGIEVLGAIASPQLAYVAFGVSAYLVRSSRLVPSVQAAIGRELGSAFEVPRSLPPRVAALVRKLQRT